MLHFGLLGPTYSKHVSVYIAVRLWAAFGRRALRATSLMTGSDPAACAEHGPAVDTPSEHVSCRHVMKI